MGQKSENAFLKEIKPFVIERYGEKKANVIMEMSRIRYHEICRENADEPKAMDIHTKQRIYPGIAVFDALLANGENRKNAADLIVNYYTWRSKRMADMIHHFMKIPGIYKLIPKFFRSMTKKMFGAEAGFKAKFYQTEKNELRFDMICCPYYNICQTYGCPEIVKAYCYADDVCYGNIHPKVIWGRTKILGGGDECCDFKITVKKEN